MYNYYDDDDFTLDVVERDFDRFDLGEEDMDVYDFDSKLDDILAELEAEIAACETSLELALREGYNRDNIERLEDELSLLLMSYSKYER